MSLSPDQKLAAYLLGRRIAGQRRKQDRVPVAYLYNGVRLPGLPEVPKEYSFVFMWSGTGYYEVCFATVESVVYSASNLSIFPVAEGTTRLEFIYKGSGTWEETIYSGKEYTGYTAFVSNNMVWTNIDLKYKGTDNVFFGASDPVPVYE